MPTAREIIDGARIQHWSFSDRMLGDGAAVLHLTTRLRTLLLRYREAVRPLVNVSVQTAGVVNGLLVGIDAGGLPVYTATIADGYAVHVDGSGIPYVDASEAPVAWDPFGASGGTPGWPLPVDAIALFSLYAVFQDGSTGKIDVLDEAERHRGPAGHYLAAFISGNRIIPMRQTVATTDAWVAVTGVQLSYLPLPTITTIDSPTILPGALGEALTAGIAELLAMQSKECPVAEKRDFSARRAAAEAALDSLALDIIGDLQVTSVIYEG